MEELSTRELLVRIAGGFILVGIAIAAGLWLGEWSVPEVPIPEVLLQSADASGRLAPSGPQALTQEPPLFLFARSNPDDPTLAVDQEAMAEDAGIHRYVLELPLPWKEGTTGDALAILSQALDRDPVGAFLLYLDLNPPLEWLLDHPDETAVTGGQKRPYASLSSHAWLGEAEAAAAQLAQAIARWPHRERVLGYILAAQEDGRWLRTTGYETSRANEAGFRAWLTRRYQTDAALQGAWRSDGVTLANAGIPEPPAYDQKENLFFRPDTERWQVDFLEYQSDITADAIAVMTLAIKGIADVTPPVYAPYGYAFEPLPEDAGQLALGQVIDREIDGFISPVSLRDRGLGGAGGPMGPIDSVLFRGKQWFIMDDTRTGVSRDPVTGEVGRMRGVRAPDVFNVQWRNFAQALVRGAGIIWTDAEGQGALLDQPQWKTFARMRGIYADRWLNVPVRASVAQAPERPLGEGDDEGAAPVAEKPSRPPYFPGLMVVADEASRYFQRPGTPLNDFALQGARDAALSSGASTYFCLLDDVLAERVPPAAAYLFLNTFALTTEQRTKLHALMEEYHAAALWYYAPGYIDDQRLTKYTRATVQMNIEMFDGGGMSGSYYLLGGSWLAEREEVGQSRFWNPLFFINDPNVDVLATFRDSGKPSIAVRFFESGAASVFLAEPNLTPGLLRSILSLLEVPIIVAPGPPIFDTLHVGDGIVAVHARQAGDRTLDFGRYYDVHDLIEPGIGWPQRASVPLTLKAGETRLLRLDPLQAEASGG